MHQAFRLRNGPAPPKGACPAQQGFEPVSLTGEKGLPAGLRPASLFEIPLQPVYECGVVLQMRQA